VKLLVVIFFGWSKVSPGMRTLIVSANLALMLSAVFAPFFGAILLVLRGYWAVVEVVVGRLAAEVGGARIRLCE